MAKIRIIAANPSQKPLQCNSFAIQKTMKTATMPALRVELEFRGAIESILNQGERLSGFMIESLKLSIYHRKTREAFVKKGLVAEQKAQEEALYFSNKAVLSQLDEMLSQAKK